MLITRRKRNLKKTLLAAKDISKEFGKDRGAVPVLNHVSVDIYEDDFTIIMGPSGAGKSTQRNGPCFFRDCGL